MLTHIVRWVAPHRDWIVRRRLLRWIARRILMIHREGSVTSIHLGRARGLLWRRSKRYVVTEYWLGTFEPLVQQAIADGLSPGDTFFDVGSHSAFHSLVGAGAVGETGLVVAIEPDPANAADIEGQVALNGFDRVIVVRKVVVADLSEPWPWVDGSAVTPTTIDQLTHEFQPPTLIKVDVEGLEIEVLRGAHATLREHRPTLVIEAHFGELAAAAFARLTALGYRCTSFPFPYGPGIPPRGEARVSACPTRARSGPDSARTRAGRQIDDQTFDRQQRASLADLLSGFLPTVLSHDSFYIVVAWNRYSRGFTHANHGFFGCNITGK